MDAWVEQQQQQRATWEVRAISAEAADRDLQARLSKANEDRRAAKSYLAVVHRDKPLASRVKILQGDLATARKATGGRPAAQAREGAEGAEGPMAQRAGGGGGTIPPAFANFFSGSQVWHAQAEAAAGQLSAVGTGLRLAVLASGQAVEVANVALDLA